MFFGAAQGLIRSGPTAGYNLSRGHEHEFATGVGNST
jgi:hypothetical protein